MKTETKEIVIGSSSKDYEYLLVGFAAMLARAISNNDTKREQLYARNIAILQGSQQ